MKQPARRSDCPINFALELFGDRWTLLIIRDLAFKGKRFYGEFLQSEEGIATNILSDRLSTLEKNGIVRTSADPAHKQKKIYQLTQKGIDLMPVLVEIIVWSARHDKNTATDKNFLRAAKKDKEGLIAEIIRKLSNASEK